MPYPTEAVTAYCYEGTTCLKNKFEIRDPRVLDEFEGSLVLGKQLIFQKSKDVFDFSENQYRQIHRFLFEDIYDWAGEYRIVDISKGATRFAPAEQIPFLMKSCFKRLEEKNGFENELFDEFVDDIVDFYCVTNYIHPFREGNGRTQRLFLSKLIEMNGYDLEFSRIDRYDLMIATVQASAGVRDNLIGIFKDNLVFHK